MAKSKSKQELEDSLANTLAEWMNPENADSDVSTDDDEAQGVPAAPATTKAAKPAAGKVDDVASAFNDLFNS